MIRSAEKRRLRALAVPFMSEQPMVGPPNCTAKDLQTPQLRQCTFDLDTIVFEDRLGGGLDGYVWKVKFGDKGPYALKVFWDAAAPRFRHYYAAQRECQNAAVLQMMHIAVQSSPVLVLDSPETEEEARCNFYAFSEESRQAQPSSSYGIPIGTRLIHSIPRMVQCYGWLKLSGSLFQKMPAKMRAPPIEVDNIHRSIRFDVEYIAVVYELVEEGVNNPVDVERVADFLWHAGFSYTLSSLARNWIHGVLVDLSDIVHFGGFGWKKELYGMRRANRILIE